MIGIDWIAVALLAAAWVYSRASTGSLTTKNWVFAAALFAIAGWRLRAGAQGTNLLLVAVAAILGVTYAVQALRGPK